MVPRERPETHAKRRARQRYGIELNDQDLIDIANLIRKNRAERVKHFPRCGHTLYRLDYRGVTIYPLYGRWRGKRRVLTMYDWENCP